MSTTIIITTGETSITIVTDSPVTVSETADALTEQARADLKEAASKPDAYYPDSSFIGAIYWMPEDDGKTVEMDTADGGTYRYKLTREQFDAWGHARSAGAWYHENIGSKHARNR